MQVEALAMLTMQDATQEVLRSHEESQFNLKLAIVSNPALTQTPEDFHRIFPLGDEDSGVEEDIDNLDEDEIINTQGKTMRFVGEMSMEEISAILDAPMSLDPDALADALGPTDDEGWIS